MTIKAQIWLVKRVWEITHWEQLNGLIPSIVEGPDGAYASAKWVLLVQRGIPIDPTPALDVCLRVGPFKIPNKQCYVFPVIWRDKVWHRGGGWERHRYHEDFMRVSGVKKIPIPEEDDNGMFELIGLHEPKEHPEIPTEWHGKSSLELDIA